MQPYTKEILIVDSDSISRQILETRLLISGYKVLSAVDGEEALRLCNLHQPDMVILDILLPKVDGYGVCYSLRKESNIPIIIITALDDISDRIMGLDFGADDYIIKPFCPKELNARIRSVLRRDTKFYKPKPNKKKYLITIGSVSIDVAGREVSIAGEKIHLTTLEFTLLELLTTKAGQVLSRTYILNNVWGYIPERYVDTRIVDVHISRLRYKIEKDSRHPNLILTIRGVGYMFQKYHNSAKT